MRQELRELDTVSFKESDIVTEELPRVFVSKKFQLRLKATVTNTTLTSGQTYGSKVANSPATLLRRIDLRVVGKGRTRTQLIKSISGEEIVKQAPYESRGLQENVSNVPTGTTSVGAGDTISYGSYDLNFSIPEVDRVAFQGMDKSGNRLSIPSLYQPTDLTLFDPIVYNPVELIVTWGSLANLASGYTAGVLTLKSAELKVVTLDLPEVNAGRAESARIPFAINREMRKQVTNTGANTDFRIDLPKGNEIRKVIIHAIDNSLYNNSIVNNVKLVVDENTNVIDASFNQIRNENAKFYGIPFADLQDGIAIIDFDEKRDLKGTLNVVNVDNVRLALDINAPTGTSNIIVVTQEITPQ